MFYPHWVNLIPLNVKPLSHEAAMTYLFEQSGTHFDPVCVEAWSRVCEEDVETTYPISNEITFETPKALSK
jgi:response regulator RpfG family c-di-GMP phosphodiesterase